VTTRDRLLELLTQRLDRRFVEALTQDGPASPAEVALRLAAVAAREVLDVVMDEAVTDADIRGALPRLTVRWDDVDREARHDAGLLDGDQWRGLIETLAGEGDLAGTAALGYACAIALDRERQRVKAFASTARDLVYALECRMDPDEMP
jgi:hypothetical protein